MRALMILHERKTPPGLEWIMLRNMHWAMLAATVIPLLTAVGARLLSGDPYGAAAAKTLASIDIFCIALAVTLWTAVFTVVIGCVVVHIMKGPAYVADPLEIDGD